MMKNLYNILRLVQRKTKLVAKVRVKKGNTSFSPFYSVYLQVFV